MAIERKRSARGRADAAIRSVVDRRAVGKDSASAPEAPPAPAGRAATGQRPQSAGRHFVDSAQRCSLAGFAGRIPASLHVLAAIAELRGASGLAGNLARVSRRIERTPAGAVE